MNIYTMNLTLKIYQVLMRRRGFCLILLLTNIRKYELNG